MIQRIQSLLLLLAAGGSLSLLGLPFASSSEVLSASVFADRKYAIFDQPALLALFILGGALALIAIFLFKNRTLQMRLTIFSFIANLIGIILAVVLYMQDPIANAEGVSVQDGIGLYPPIIALILLLVALRFIRKDDKLVRSMDRLR
jgi:hypothetical protein